MANIFIDISVIIVIATAFGFVARLTWQPLIPAYILAGIIIGPSLFGLGLTTDGDIISTLSEIGTAFMLFVVGMELDFRRLMDSFLVPSLIFAVIIVIIKPILIMFISSLFGYSRKTSFLTGRYLAQISVTSDRIEKAPTMSYFPLSWERPRIPHA